MAHEGGRIRGPHKAGFFYSLDADGRGMVLDKLPVGSTRV